MHGQGHDKQGLGGAMGLAAGSHLSSVMQHRPRLCPRKMTARWRITCLGDGTTAMAKFL